MALLTSNLRDYKNNVVLDIAEIEYFFIVLELNKVEYLVFLFFFSYFLFRTKLLFISSLTACDRCVHYVGCIIAPWVQPTLDKTPH